MRNMPTLPGCTATFTVPDPPPAVKTPPSEILRSPTPEEPSSIWPELFHVEPAPVITARPLPSVFTPMNVPPVLTAPPPLTVTIPLLDVPKLRNVGSHAEPGPTISTVPIEPALVPT